MRPILVHSPPDDTQAGLVLDPLVHFIVNITYSKPKFTGIIIDKSEIDDDVRIELICDFCGKLL